jgi:hypothetical protein
LIKFVELIAGCDQQNQCNGDDDAPHGPRCFLVSNISRESPNDRNERVRVKRPPTDGGLLHLESCRRFSGYRTASASFSHSAWLNQAPARRQTLQNP